MIPNSFYRISFIMCLLLSIYDNVFCQNFDGGFNFSLPPFDSTTQKFLPTFPAKTISEADRVTVVGEKFTAGGQQIRFWGVNIIGGACFPKKTDAVRIAGRLRKMGVNLVRLHDLENGYSEPDGSIFDWGVTTRSLKATTLDRMEYFIAELKKNNIYVNINLNTSRRYVESDGVAGADTLFSRDHFGAGAVLFEPYLQFLQREYAQQLLTHLNPYTGQTLANDPVLAQLELNGETTMYGAWKEERLQWIGGVLTYQHNRTLNDFFQTFLVQKYTTNAALNTAWQPSTVDARELIQNGGFETGAVGSPWLFETLNPNAVATVSADNTNARTGTFSARFNVTSVTTFDAHIRLRQAGFPFENNKRYLLTFWAKSDVNDRDLKVQLMQDYEPNAWFSSNELKLTTAWKQYSIEVNTAMAASNVRLVLMPRSIGTIWIDDISLRQVVPVGMKASENLATRNIDRISWWERRNYTPQRVADMAEFYIGLQKKHFDDFRQYLRSTLNVKALVTGTNAFVGPADAMTQTNMDYVDEHSYWDHVQFKGAWNTTDWWIANKSMLKTPDLESVSKVLVGLNLTNKPYTISEHNNNAPSRYRNEIALTMLPYAALHGVDGLTFFCYNGYDRGLDWEGDFINHHFSIHRDNSVMSLFPSCALAFRNGYIKEDNNPIRLNFMPTEVYNSPFKDDLIRWEQYIPHDRKLGLLRGMKTDSYGTISTPAPAYTNPNGNTFVTATNETKFDPTKGGLTTATPNFVSITGFLPDMPNTTAGDLQLVQANQFGALTWVSLQNKPLNVSEKSLITFSSRQQNTNMVWSFYENDPTKFTVRDQWGTAPTLQQAAILRLRLNVKADMIKLYPLSNTGREGTARTLLPTATNSNTFDVTIDQNQDKTLWYGVEAVIKVGVKEQAIIKCTAVPNPVTEGSVNTQYLLPQSGHLTIQLYNLQGQLVKSMAKKDQIAGNYSENIALPDVANGQYFLFFNLLPHAGNGLNGCVGKIPLVIAR